MKKNRFNRLLMSMAVLATLSGCSIAHPKTDETSDTSTTNAQKATATKLIDTTIDSKRGSRLPATIVTPEKMTAQSYPLVLFSHGFNGARKGFPGEDEEVWVFETIATRLAEQGILSVMVDFPGCNDSQEPSSEYTIKNMENDMDTALAYMFENYPIDKENVGLMGHSMGGRLTALHLSDTVKAAALWTPAANPGLSGLYDFMGGETSVEELYKQAKEQGSVDFDLFGEPYTNLSLAFFEENDAVNPLQAISDYRGNLFLAVALADPLIPKTTTDNVVAAAVNAQELEVITVEKASHIFTNVEDETDYRQQNYVIDETTDFLIRNLSLAN
ncbi:alpha/beta hydrolase family protein [Enterococcus sp. AZ109]|uniref:alpha/beta hydrolase family protein n=1 Tax=Enterococcus sp. AZ109 TaxID=2774634 RepID=UPI003F28344E